MALKDFNLQIKQGEFICVIGEVGSGKSSLLSAIIGDLLYANPDFMIANGEEYTTLDMRKAIVAHSQLEIAPKEAPIRVSEKIAYVQQVPWIQNKTIKQNILFGLEYDEDLY